VAAISPRRRTAAVVEVVCLTEALPAFHRERRFSQQTNMKKQTVILAAFV